MAKNTYKQDEVLEEPFDIRHLLRASSYIKKYAGRMVVAILLSGIGGAFGYVAPMIIQRALDLAIPDKNEKLLFSLVGMLVGIYVVSVIFTTNSHCSSSSFLVKSFCSNAVPFQSLPSFTFSLTNFSAFSYSAWS